MSRLIGKVLIAAWALLPAATNAAGWVHAERIDVGGRVAIRITWSSPERIGSFTGLRVERQDFDTARKPEVVAELAPEAREYIDDTAGPGVRWMYFVQAYDEASGTDKPFAPPAVARVSTDPDPPAPPGLRDVRTVAQEAEPQVLASYVASADEEGGALDVVAYCLYRSARDPGSPPTGGELVGESYPVEGTESDPGVAIDPSPVPGSSYWYWLTASDGTNESLPSEVIGPVTVVDSSARLPFERALGILKTALAIAVTLGLAISIHELGHLLIAKAFRIKADEFAVGFGKKLLWRKLGDTVYSLRIVPLGGFVRVRGMVPDEVHDPDGIYAKRPHARVAVIVSGALMNIVLAYVLYVCLVAISSPGSWLRVYKITPGDPAAAAGLQRNDLILAVNGREYTSWQHTVAAIARSPGRPLNLTISRGGVRSTVTVVPSPTQVDDRVERLIFGLGGSTVKGVIGIRPRSVRMPPVRDPVAVAVWAGRYTRESVGSLLGFLRDLLLGRARASETVGGPIAIAQQVHEARQAGLPSLLYLAAYLNLCLAVFNLLPFPMLDGIKAIIMVIEGVRGRLFNKEREAAFHFAGMVVLLIMAVLVARLDIIRLVGGGRG